ncbi:MAG TPA: hypothetical protein VI819_00050 [Patescibacteria group bacterium]|nr:hypothetical protein [Patescibacteria group bacterium]
MDNLKPIIENFTSKQLAKGVNREEINDVLGMAQYFAIVATLSEAKGNLSEDSEKLVKDLKFEKNSEIDEKLLSVLYQLKLVNSDNTVGVLIEKYFKEYLESL